jgi:hypothetical protein
LVEKTVFLFSRRNSRLERDIHAAVDPLYLQKGGPERDREFHRIYGEFFSKLELGGVIREVLAEYPLIQERVDRCLVVEAQRRKDESSELLVRPPKDDEASPARTLLIQVCPQSLLDPEKSAGPMRRELLHVSDMLDAAFAYDRQDLEGQSAEQNLIRDRYRVLWDIYVEARLFRDGRINDGGFPRLLEMFPRAFPLRDPQLTQAIVAKLRNTFEVTHSRLLSWARDPSLLSRLDPCFNLMNK